MDRISVIVPAWNAEETLRGAVDSLVATGYPDLEIIIVDDGSRDSTFALATTLQEGHSTSVRAIQHEDRKRHGVSASRNLGIRVSTGNWIAFLDADDYVLPHRFTCAAGILAAHHDVDAVIELARVEYENNVDEDRFWNGSRLFGATEYLAADGLLSFLLAGRSWPTSAILLRRRLLDKSGLFNESLTHAEDCHLWLRLAVTGKLIQGSVKEPVSVYRRHGKNTFDTRPERKLDMLRALLSAHTWARQSCDSNATKDRFKQGVKQYFLRSLVTYREQGRPDLAKSAVTVVIKSAAYSALLNTAVMRQIFALYLNRAPKSAVNFHPSGS